jgi:hypothetical protein
MNPDPAGLLAAPFLEEPRSAQPVATKPPRLSFTGLCLYCETFGCESDECVERHRLSCWGVCLWCEGTATVNDIAPCTWCLWGVCEIVPTDETRSCSAGRSPSGDHDRPLDRPMAVTGVTAIVPVPSPPQRAGSAVRGDR